MTHYTQLPNSHNCGQIAVAAFLGIPVEEVIRVVGHSHCTTTRELVSALRILGAECPDRLQRTPDGPCLMKVRDTRKSGWHWVAFGGGSVYDGCLPHAVSFTNYLLYCRDTNRRVTSYLPVRVYDA
jgi:hypothetical protein